MSENIRKHKQLTVVSDTALFAVGDAKFGFGPVVRELEYIAPMFEKIVWIGFDRPEESGSRAFERITADNIETIRLKKCGGNRFADKLNVLSKMPQMAFVVLKHTLKAQVIHTRAPSAPAFIAVLSSYVLRRKIWWNKYAGSWNQGDAPFFYELQRSLFAAAGHTNVTVNGFWKDQPKHCFSFENPCLTDAQIAEGRTVQAQKKFNAPYRLAFVGNLVEKKGVSRIINALKNIDERLIERIDFVGDGANRKEFEKSASFLGAKAVFHGFLDNAGVHNILSEAHFFLLPSDSEGFPKVIAEAACYGCIPIVSDAGSIGHYVGNETNGFLWQIDGEDSFQTILERSLTTSPSELEQKSKNILQLAEKFTFANYRRKLEEHIL